MDCSNLGVPAIDSRLYFGITSSMNTLDEVLQYRKQVEQAREQAAKAEGRLEFAMDRLSHEHQCKDVKAGRRALEQLRLNQGKAEHTANKKLEAFAEKWKEHLSDDSQ